MSWIERIVDRLGSTPSSQRSRSADANHATRAPGSRPASLQVALPTSNDALLRLLEAYWVAAREETNPAVRHQLMDGVECLRRAAQDQGLELDRSAARPSGGASQQHDQGTVLAAPTRDERSTSDINAHVATSTSEADQSHSSREVATSPPQPEDPAVSEVPVATTPDTVEEPPRDSLPATLPITVAGVQLELDRLTSDKGNAWYAFVSDRTGDYLPSGRAIDPPASELPPEIGVAGVATELGPAPKWDDDLGGYTDELEPFEEKRQAEATIVLCGVTFEVHAKVTLRRDSKWNVTVRVVPRESTTHLELEPPSAQLGAPEQAAADEVEEVQVEQVADEPPIDVPLFRIDGRWHWRWKITSELRAPLLPRDLLELNNLNPAEPHQFSTDHGVEIRTHLNERGTAVVFHGALELLDQVSANSGDYLFVGPGTAERFDVRRLTKQKLGKANDPLKRAALLCGLSDDDVTVPHIAWTMGVEDPGNVSLDDLVSIAVARSDGLVASALQEQVESIASPLPTLDSTFSRLNQAGRS